MNINKKGKYKITETIYDNISTVLIPLILTFLVEVFKYKYNCMLNMKTETGIILRNAFPNMEYILIILFIPYCLISLIIVFFCNQWLRNRLFNTPNEEKYMKNAFLRLKEFGYKRQDSFRIVSNSEISNSDYYEFLITSHKNSIDLVVSTCLDFFKNSFSEQGSLVSKTSFEVSFMSKSFTDDKITIVSSDNNTHRTPPSMLLRKSNSEIYENTETGKIYKHYNTNPSETLAIHIIEDCTTQNEFTALYNGQKDFIKSMAVLPILSPQNELLGTLVICANQVSFFKAQESHFWNELLEIFSVELGYHYMALKYCININGGILSKYFKEPF